MGEEHRLIQLSSHVTSFVGRVGVVGLCSCGFVIGEEGEDTRMAVLMLSKAWEAHQGGMTSSSSWPLPPASS
jgi:hypothetical protein